MVDLYEVIFRIQALEKTVGFLAGMLTAEQSLSLDYEKAVYDLLEEPMADKAPPNKGGTCSGVGSNMPSDHSSKEAIRSISEKNHPCGTTDTQTAIRGISRMGPDSSGKSQSKP